MKHDRELMAWQKAMDLVEAIYDVTRELPSAEKYGRMSHDSISLQHLVASSTD